MSIHAHSNSINFAQCCSFIVSKAWEMRGQSHVINSESFQTFQICYSNVLVDNLYSIKHSESCSTFPSGRVYKLAIIFLKKAAILHYHKNSKFILLFWQSISRSLFSCKGNYFLVSSSKLLHFSGHSVYIPTPP